MAEIVNLPTHHTNSGELTVIEKLLPGEVKRVFYIKNTNNTVARGGHSHKTATHLLVCVAGSCSVMVKNTQGTATYTLDSPEKALILDPTDWRLMENFEENTVLLVVSNQYFDQDDYIYAPEYEMLSSEK
jgi:hypothetical protein